MEQDRDFIFKEMYIVAHAQVLQNLKDRTRNLVAARIPPPRRPGDVGPLGPVLPRAVRFLRGEKCCTTAPASPGAASHLWLLST